MTQDQETKLLSEKGDGITQNRNAVEVIYERISNIQESIRQLNVRFDKWESDMHEQNRDYRTRDEELLRFKSTVEGAVRGVSGTVRVMAWALGSLQLIVIAWVGTVNFTTHNIDTRMEKLEVYDDISAKDANEHKTTIDTRLNGIDSHLSHNDADIDQLKLDLDRMSRQQKGK